MPTYKESYRGAFHYTGGATPPFPNPDYTTNMKLTLDELYLATPVQNVSGYVRATKIIVEWDTVNSYWVFTMDYIRTWGVNPQTITETFLTYDDLLTRLEYYGLRSGNTGFKGVARCTMERTDISSNLFVGGSFSRPSDNAIFLYLLKGEKEEITKDLTFVESNYVSFNTTISPTNFNLLIKKNITDMKNHPFNYVYISTLHRFYFVDNTELTNDMMNLHLSEDVLSSWDKLIRDQSGFVTRNENMSSEYLVDERRPLDNTLTVDYEIPTDGLLVNFSFTTNNDDNPNIRNIIVCGFYPSTVVTASTSVTPISGSDLPKIEPYFFGLGYPRTYVLKGDEYSILYKAMVKDDVRASFISSIVAFPIDFYDFLEVSSPRFAVGTDEYWGVDETQDKFKKYDPADPSTYTDIMTVTQFASKIPPYLVLGDFTISEMYNPLLKPEKAYLNYQITYELFIPYYGWVKMNASDIVAKRLLVYYTLNPSTGSSTVYIYNYTDSKILFSDTCVLGVSLGVTTTNLKEIETQRKANSNNLKLGLISSGVSSAIGVIKGNPLTIATGLISASKTIANNVNSNMMLFERLQSSFSGGIDSLYASQHIVIKKTYHDTLTTNESKYAHTQGYPINRYMVFTTLTGYTEIAELHFVTDESDIYSDEIEMIVNQLKNGVIF